MSGRKILRTFESFWMMPFILGIFAILAAQFTIVLDEFLLNQNIQLAASRDIGVDGARSILTALAGSVLGVAATSFSITTSVLATASSTYGPRLVRNFMGDRRNQFILGSFGAAFLYAIMILRSIRDSSDVGGIFIPAVSVDIAILAGIVNVALLIYFIHHISDSIQISTLISRVRDDLIRSVRALYSEQPADTAIELEMKGVSDVKVAHDHAKSTDLPNEKPIKLRARGDGYVTYIDFDWLLEEAKRQCKVVKLLVQPGDFIYRRQPIVHVWFDGAQEEFDKEEEFSWVLDAISTSTTRSPHDDIRYAIQQPVDITIRALSPGTNDPYTAINALQGLGSGLVRLVELHNMPSVMYDGENPRVFKHTITIEHLIESTFRTLRSNVVGSVDATLEVLYLADTLLNITDISSYRRIILKAVASVSDAFMESSSPGLDKQIIKNAADQVIKKHDDSDKE